MTAPLNAWPVPDGFVIVPREPTPAMLDHPTVTRHLFNRWQTMLVWDAMLAAAPAPPVQSPRTQDSVDFEYCSGRVIPREVKP
jgi:hypothetical protein